MDTKWVWISYKVIHSVEELKWQRHKDSTFKREIHCILNLVFGFNGQRSTF